MQIAVWVVALVLGIQAAIWIPLVIWLRRKSARLREGLLAELESSGERVLRAPESVLYSGASGRLPQVRGNCLAALTEKRLIVRRLVGKPFDIPVSEFASVREDKWFLSSYRSGRLYVIIK